MTLLKLPGKFYYSQKLDAASRIEEERCYKEQNRPSARPGQRPNVLFLSAVSA